MADENTNLFIQLKNASGAAVFPRIDLSKNHEGKLPVAKVDGIDSYALSATVANDIAAAKLAITGNSTKTIEALDAAKANVATTLLGYGITDAYTKDEINGLIDASNFEYTVVTELPKAAEGTMYRIYFVARPTTDKGNAETGDVYDEYITLHSVVDGVDTYTWEKIGDTAIDLSSKLDVTTFNSTIANYSTTAEVGTAISTALTAYDTATVAAEKVATAKSEAIAAAKGETESQVAAAKSAITGTSTKTIADIDAAKVDKTVTVNEKALSANIVLDGSDIALTGYTAVEGGVGIVATDSINAAFKRIDENFKTLSGDSTESIGAVVGRVSTLEGEMDAVEGRLDVVEPKVTTLESITKGYTGEGAIKTAVDAKLNKTAKVNGQSFNDEAEVTVSGAHIALTGYTSAVNGAGKFEAADTINAAFVKVDEEFASISDHLGNKADSSALADVADDITNLGGRVDDIETVLDGLFDEGSLKDYISAELAKKADNATTLAGYGITDAYTQTETNNLLANKANSADVYTKTVADTTFVKTVAGLNAVYYEVLD